MNHVVLFTYVVVIAGGTGGVVALALLHHRLRTRITASFLVANIGLLASLLLALVTYYIDTVVAASSTIEGFVVTLPFERSVLRTVLGYLFGLTVYGGVTAAVAALPTAPRRVVFALGLGVIGAMTVQAGLIVSGFIAAAARLAPFYIVFVSVCLVGFGLVMIRTGASAPTPTMAWLIVRLGYLKIVFAPVSTLLYALFARIPILDALGISLDFVFYAVWSWISIGAFLRYITRPSLAGDDDEISPAFIDAFDITRREAEIIGLIAQGLSNQEIADRLGISFGTVRTHVYNIFQKSGAGSRVDLLRLVSGYRE